MASVHRALRLVLVVGLVVGGASASVGAEPTDPVGVWPMMPTPQVVRGFDPPDSPYGAGHRGVDLLGRVGQPVRAAMAGTVGYAGRLAGRGVVVVDHGSTRTTYEPVVAEVAVGDPVGAGARLGTLEYAGTHCPPTACLHWGWIEGDTYLDPLWLVGLGPVRLLPLWRDRPADPGTPGPGAPWRPLGVIWLDLLRLDLLRLDPPRLDLLRLRPVGAPAGRPAAAARW